MEPVQGVITTTLQQTDQGAWLGGGPISQTTHPSIIFSHHLSQFIHFSFNQQSLYLSRHPFIVISTSSLSLVIHACLPSSSVYSIHFLFPYYPASLFLSISLSTHFKFKFESLFLSMPYYISTFLCTEARLTPQIFKSPCCSNTKLQLERDGETMRKREREREEVIISESQKLRRLSTRTFCLFEIHCNLMLVKILLSFSSQEKDNSVFSVCSGHLNKKVHLGPCF